MGERSIGKESATLASSYKIAILKAKPRITIIGIRGIPANFGGSETVVEQMGGIHAKNGFNITVYCRKWNSSTNRKIYKGMRRVVLPSVNTLGLDLPTHSLLSTMHVIVANTADIVHFHGVGNAMFVPLLKMFGKKTIVTVDGFDWKRPKWGKFAKLVLKNSFPLLAKTADVIVSDNIPIKRYFSQRFHRETEYIVYGTDLEKVNGNDALTKFSLKPRDYFLYVGGLIPDKGVHVLVEAFEKLHTSKKLVIIGDTPYFPDYKRKLMSTNDSRITFLGYLYGKPCRQILQNAYVYVHPLISDGTSPSLLQAMAAANCIIASNLTETMGVIGDSGIAFENQQSEDLYQKMLFTLRNPEVVTSFGKKARERVAKYYNWERVAKQYADLYLQLYSHS